MGAGTWLGPRASHVLFVIRRAFVYGLANQDTVEPPKECARGAMKWCPQCLELTPVLARVALRANNREYGVWIKHRVKKLARCLITCGCYKTSAGVNGRRDPRRASTIRILCHWGDGCLVSRSHACLEPCNTAVEIVSPTTHVVPLTPTDIPASPTMASARHASLLRSTCSKLCHVAFAVRGPVCVARHCIRQARLRDIMLDIEALPYKRSMHRPDPRVVAYTLAVTSPNPPDAEHMPCHCDHGWHVEPHTNERCAPCLETASTSGRKREPHARYNTHTHKHTHMRVRTHTLTSLDRVELRLASACVRPCVHEVYAP